MESTLGTPEAPAKEQALAIAKYMVEELPPKFQKPESNDVKKRDVKSQQKKVIQLEKKSGQEEQ